MNHLVGDSHDSRENETMSDAIKLAKEVVSEHETHGFNCCKMVPCTQLRLSEALLEMYASLLAERDDQGEMNFR